MNMKLFIAGALGAAPNYYLNNLNLWTGKRNLQTKFGVFSSHIS